MVGLRFLQEMKLISAAAAPSTLNFSSLLRYLNLIVGIGKNTMIILVLLGVMFAGVKHYQGKGEAISLGSSIYSTILGGQSKDNDSLKRGD